MLGKLLKYDLKATRKVILLMCLPLFVFALTIRFSIVPSILENGADFILIIGLIGFFIYISLLSILSIIYLAVHYYQNLYSHEGYLTWTLPASPMEQLLSKWFVGIIWLFVVALVITAGVIISFTPSPLVEQIAKSLSQTDLQQLAVSMGCNSFGTFIFLSVFNVSISLIASPLFVLGCICFGQLFNSHRILWAVIGYVLLSFLSGLLGAGYLFRNIVSETYIVKDVPVSFNTSLYYKDMMIFSTLCTIVLSVICFLFSYYSMRKRVNLT